MNPPRLPLTQRPVNGMLNTLNPPSDKAASLQSKQAKPPKRQIPPEHLPAFKAEVEGSDLTKIALIESLKKKFPKLPKDAISNTLSVVAARLGAKEVEKRWVLI
jgi:chromatin assembly factor 1 subunit A